LLVAAAWGCPGTLDDPARFFVEAGVTEDASVSGGDGGGECPDVPSLFARTCTAATCHSAGNKAQGLDLQSPNLDARLVGVAASEGSGFLIDPSEPSKSVLYRKLTPTPPSGARMPLGAAPLDDATMACVLAWITGQASAVPDAASNDGGTE
jgi:hypothetical protein